MNRDEILEALSDRLSAIYDADTAEHVLSSIQGTLAELDALPPYANESAFQEQLSCLIYPFLAAVQAMDGEDCSVIAKLAHEMFIKAAAEGTLVSGRPGSNHDYPGSNHDVV